MATRREIGALDKALEQLLDEVQFQVVETDLTPEKRRERRKEADADDLAFARIYFPKIFDKPFNDAHEHIASLTSGNYTVSGFRRSGKSAFTYVGKAIKHIALGKGGIVNITLRTQDRAGERTSSLSRLILRNRMLCYDYGIEPIQDTKGYHIFKSEGGTTHLVATSVNQGLRAYMDDDFKRFVLSIGDDLYDKESVRSATDNKRVTDFVTSELWGQMEAGGLSIVLGNSINDDCPMVHLKKLSPDHHFSFPIEDKEGNPAWPAGGFDRDRIREMKLSIPFDVWEGEYMDRPAEKGDVFDPDWLRTVNVLGRQILASITAIDPSYGESPHACYKSAVTLGILPTHEVVMLDVYVRRENYILFFDYLDALRSRIPSHKAFLFENDFSQWAFAQPYYMEWMEKRKSVLPITMHSAKELSTKFRAADKESRIMNLVHPHQMGLFHYSDQVTGSADWELYRRQYLAFGAAKEKLDGLDAAATAYIMIRRYVETSTFQPTAERRFATPEWMGGGWR